MLLSCAFLPSSPLLLPGLAPQQSLELERITEACRGVARDIALLEPNTLVVITDASAAYEEAFAIDLSDPYSVSFSEFGHLGATSTYHPDVALIDALQREARRSEIPLTLHTEKFLAPHCAVSLEFFKSLLPRCRIVPIYVSLGKNAKAHVAFGELLRQVVEHASSRVSVIASADIAPQLLSPLKPIVEEHQLPQFMTFIETLWDTPEAFGLRQLATLFGVIGNTNIHPTVLEHQILFNEVGCLVTEFPLR